MIQLSADIAEAVSNYGYSAVFIFSFIESDISLALGALAVHEGFLKLHGVIIASVASAIATDLGWFWGIRSFFGKKIIGCSKHLQSAVEICTRFAGKNPRVLVFFGRFMYGFRSAIAISISATHIPFRKFASAYFAGLVLWTATISALGYFVGGAIVPFLIGLKRFHIGAVLIGAFLLGWLIHSLVIKVRLAVVEKVEESIDPPNKIDSGL